jgi:hypothetical protein
MTTTTAALRTALADKLPEEGVAALLEALDGVDDAGCKRSSRRSGSPPGRTGAQRPVWRRRGAGTLSSAERHERAVIA